MSITIEFIKSQVKSGNYELTIHADDERINEELTFAELEEALTEGDVIEDYPDDPRGASCLLLGHTKQDKPLHIVCGKTNLRRLLLITVYIPQLPKWLDPRTRNR
jgi:hypothetical protein